MKTIFIICTLMVFCNTSEAFFWKRVKKCDGGIMLYDWDMKGKCWAFDQTEKACKQIKDLNVCRNHNPTYTDILVSRRTKKGTCYELTNRGAIVQTLPMSRCQE